MRLEQHGVRFFFGGRPALPGSKRRGMAKIDAKIGSFFDRFLVPGWRVRPEEARGRKEQNNAKKLHKHCTNIARHIAKKLQETS